MSAPLLRRHGGDETSAPFVQVGVLHSFVHSSRIYRYDHVEVGFAFQAAKRPDDALRAFEAATIHEVCVRCGWPYHYYLKRINNICTI